MSRWLFLRLLGAVFLVAFLSLWVQVDGLFGSRGILPVKRFLEMVEQFAPDRKLLLAPTLCWLDAGDGFLHVLCAAGVALSVLLLLGFVEGPALLLLWAGYLSLTVAGQDFLGFQWDALLIETAFLAIFLAPWRLRSRLAAADPPPWAPLFLLRWLLFRLMLLSGIVKLASQDAVWRDLTALRYHWWTQPLPTPPCPFLHELPEWFQKAACGATLAIELAVPALVLGPRLCRRIAAWTFMGFMVVIALTGNYGFFDLLTIVLCVALLDDGSLRRLLPRRWKERLEAASPPRRRPVARRLSLAGQILLVLAVLPVTTLVAVERIARDTVLPDPARALLRHLGPFRTFNAYGLFADMTTERPEIQIEGSDDGRSWKEYGFRWKPQDPSRGPRYVAPHMPRLDWQMWFAALSPANSNPWFLDLEQRLLEGSPAVVGLFADPPFKSAPPRSVRAVLYDYRFATGDERRKSGLVWHRERRRLYTPALTLREGRLALAGF